MPTLHEIGAELSRVENEIEVLEESGELNGSLPKELEARLEALELGRDQKLSGIVKWILNLESDADAIDAEIKRLKAAKDARVNKAESLRGFLKYAMQRFGLEKFDAKIAKISVSAPRTSLEVDDEQAWNWPQDVFDAVCKQSVKVNKSLLKQLFPERYKDLPGVKELEGDPVLRIK